jgi:hypothetical protein
MEAGHLQGGSENIALVTSASLVRGTGEVDDLLRQAHMLEVDAELSVRSIVLAKCTSDTKHDVLLSSALGLRGNVSLRPRGVCPGSQCARRRESLLDPEHMHVGLVERVGSA